MSKRFISLVLGDLFQDPSSSPTPPDTYQSYNIIYRMLNA